MLKKMTLRPVLVVAVVLATALTPASAESLPTVMSIACLDGKTQVDTTTIAPQADGFHFLITKAGAAHAIQVWRSSGRGYGGFEFGDAPYEMAYAAAPGSYIIRCVAHTTNQGPPTGSVPVQLSDPTGIYHRSTLDGCATRSSHAGGPIASETETPEEAIIRIVGGIRDTDLVEYTRFPQGPRPFPPTYRVVRGDKTVARVAAVKFPPDDPNAVWALGVTACRAAGIG
jgi:hypothetical protein